jgi:rod shape-determining protein MreD
MSTGQPTLALGRLKLSAGVAVLIALVVVQTSILPHLIGGGLKPNLVLVWVASWSLLNGAREGALWALGGGLLLDLLSGAPFASSTISLLLVSQVSGVEQVRAIHSTFFFPVLVAATTLMADLYLLAHMSVAGWPVEWSLGLFGSTALIVVMNLISGLVLFPLVERLSSRPAVEQEGW